MYIRPKTFYKTYRLELGAEFGTEKPEDVFIVLREPSIIELTDIDGAGVGSTSLKALLKALPGFIIDHNIYNSETEKSTNEQVVEMVSANIAASVKLLKDYLEAVKRPFQNKKGLK